MNNLNFVRKKSLNCSFFLKKIQKNIKNVEKY